MKQFINYCCEIFLNCERFFWGTHWLSIVKMTISLFPPYFRNLELDVLDNIFYHHSTIKEYDQKHAAVEKKDTRRLKAPPKKKMKAKSSLPKKKPQKKPLQRKAPKKRVSKKKKAVKQKQSKKKEVKFQWLDIESYFQSDVIKFYELNTFFSLKSRNFEKYCPAKKPQVWGK